jgi:hypothetical protein
MKFSQAMKLYLLIMRAPFSLWKPLLSGLAR